MNAPDQAVSDQAVLGRLVAERAALERLATVVVGAAPPVEVFNAVADELALLVGAEVTYLARLDPTSSQVRVRGDYVTVFGSRCRHGDQVPVGLRLRVRPGTIQATALHTGRPARGTSDLLSEGPDGAWLDRLDMRTCVATPVAVVGGQRAIAIVLTSREDFPADTESRMTGFLTLAAPVIATASTRQRLDELGRTQAALRRLATLVAQGEPPEAVFAAATEEALRHFGSGTARMVRYELDGTATLVANEGTTGPHVRVGQRWDDYPPTGLTATVRRTGQPARVDDYRDTPGGERYLREGLRSAVAMPIHLDGRLWGMIAVGTGEGPPPLDTEQRMTEFTDLVATSVASAQNRHSLEKSRDELTRLLTEQAALHRVATLVARRIDPGEIFVAVAEEMRRLLGADSTGIARFEPGGSSIVIAGGVGAGVPERLPVGTRVELVDYLAPALVWRTGRSAQVDEDAWRDRSDPFAVGMRELGIRSMVASPIIVEGGLWGVVNALSTHGPFPSDTADRMADFTELVATAIGNAESRAELAASRMRLVAATDQTRRRIERDLHDGTQQRLVALCLKLRLTQSLVPADAPGLRTEIDRIADELNETVEDLREIARGIHPAILSEGGLTPALRTLARRAAVAVELDVAVLARLPEPVEVAAYYVVSEALTNATRHAQASVVEVAAHVSGEVLRVRVHDDGCGGADPDRGSGLVGLKDRIEALSGVFTVHSSSGGGTTLSCELPVGAGRRADRSHLGR